MLFGLSPFQKLVTLAFLGSLVVIYSLAAIMVLRWIVRKIAHRRPPQHPRWRRISGHAVVSLAILGCLCMAYGRFIEPRWVEVTHAQVSTVKLQPGKSVRIVHISDLHCDAKMPAEEALIAAVTKQRPNLIVFTGDATNSQAGRKVFARCMQRLAQIAPLYGVKGNWDCDDPVSPMADTKARELDGDAVAIQANGAELTLVGFGAADAPDSSRVRGGIDRSRLLVMLYHHPDEIMSAARQGVDLYLAGHTHGGQLRLPWYGALVTLSKYGKRFEWGLHRVDDTWLYVNRGIGMEGGRAPRVRFLARPEVTIIDLVSADAK